MSARLLTEQELELVSGGRGNDSSNEDIFGDIIVNGQRYEIDWGYISSLLEGFSGGFENASAVTGGIAGIAALGAAAQLGLDVPNDVAAAAFGGAAGLSHFIAWGLHEGAIYAQP